MSQSVHYVRSQAIITQFPPIFTDSTPEVTMRTIHHHQEWDRGHPGSRDHQPGLLIIYSLHLPQAMRGTTLNEQHKPHSLMSNFSIAYFLDLMIYDLFLVASLSRCCLIRCHPSPDDTGWQLDMITNKLPEQSGLAWPRAGHEISENQFLICCLLGSDNTVIRENKS